MRCRTEPSTETETERLVAKPTYSLGARPTATTDELTWRQFGSQPVEGAMLQVVLRKSGAPLELGQLEQLRVMRAREHAGALAAAVEEVAQARVQEGDAVLRIGPLSKLVDEAERTAGGVAHHVAHLRQVSLLKVASVEAPRSTPRPSLHWL